MADSKQGMKIKGFVLITGASSGIGMELARIFAFNGYSLLLSARNAGRLNALAEELRSQYGVGIHVFACDLSLSGSAEKLFKAASDIGVPVDILVNNAGAGCCGLFHEMELKRIEELLRLDVEALTVLARLFAGQMVRRGTGRILNVASTGSYQPGPYIAAYYAAKAYVLSLSHAMAAELHGTGVRVTALCPGATRTGFAEAAGKADIPSAMEPAAVAKAAYRGLMRGKRVVIPGVGSKLVVFVTKLLPGRLNAAIVKKIQKSMLDKYCSEADR